MKTAPRCYTVKQLLDVLQLSRSAFFRLRKAGQLPFLEELSPRLGRTPRYRADLVDRYLANTWGGPRAVRRSA
jgi:predicted DNA-binding transcriptional regulator AlpA